MAKLTGPQIGQLQEIILDAFDLDDLENLLLTKLDKRLAHIVSKDDDLKAAALK